MMRLAKHVARMGENGNISGCWWTNMKVISLLEDLCICGMIILKRILHKQHKRGLDSAG